MSLHDIINVNIVGVFMHNNKWPGEIHPSFNFYIEVLYEYKVDIN